MALDGLGNNIEDAEFFPDLPGLVREVADRLTRLMDLDRHLISALHKASHLLPFASIHLLKQSYVQRTFSACVVWQVMLDRAQ